MTSTTGLCVLCNVEVTEEDYRREVDCPSKTCPGRVYHEDCIATYLRRTKYSKDRCTGFPCPAILSTGKPCPGYVCKMHTFFPSNQKKKQARIANAAVAAPKPRPTAVKPKPAGAQLAIAAMSRGTPEGVPPSGGGPKALKPPEPTGGAIMNASPGPVETNVAQEPRYIPGFDPDMLVAGSRPRASKSKARAQSAATGVTKQSPNDVGGMWPDSSGNSDSDGREWPPTRTTVWEAFATESDLARDLNYFDLERHNNQYGCVLSGGQFSAMLRDRFTSGAPNQSLEQRGAKPQRDSFYGNPNNKRATDSSQAVRASNAAVNNARLALSDSPPAAESYIDRSAMGVSDGELRSDTVATVAAIDQNDDPVVEYDQVYAGDDGSYLVLDAVSNAYFRLEDMYGASPELVEFPGEDGNVYTYVVVRKSLVEVRAQRQMAVWDAREQQGQQLQQEEAAEAVALMGTGDGAAACAAFAQSRDDAVVGAGETRAAAAVADEENDLALVEDLMQLLGV